MDATSPVTFAIKPQPWIRNIAMAAVSAEILLVLLDYVLNFGNPRGYGPVRRLFNITREDALASWFASTQTLLVALTLFVIYAVTRTRSESKLTRRGWLAVALFFLYMAVDDGAKVHERLGSTLGYAFEPGSQADGSGLSRVVDLFPSYNWQLFLLPMFALAGVGLLLFLWRELPDWRSRALLLAALGCLTVAVSLDFVEGLDEEHPWNLHAHLDSWIGVDLWVGDWFGRTGFDTIVHFSKSLEEFLEMLANTLLWVLFLRHLTRSSVELRIRFASSP